MRVNGGSAEDDEFKWFQEELVNGGDVEAMWQWLCKNINFVNYDTEEYIELLKKNGEEGKLSD